VLGVSDERVRQVEERALHKLRSIGLLKRMHRHSE
jgi:DNA-directed RNA polymerase sigma subunit (sigma70/sigma32)